jgi:hypothetical protein
VALRSVVEIDGVPAGRFWRDAHGSMRLELDVPDAEGRTIVIHNIPQATYYVYRPAGGWTAQPMLLPDQRLASAAGPFDAGGDATRGTGRGLLGLRARA